jgi:hypothetical protein
MEGGSVVKRFEDKLRTVNFSQVVPAQRADNQSNISKYEIHRNVHTCIPRDSGSVST